MFNSLDSLMGLMAAIFALTISYVIYENYQFNDYYIQYFIIGRDYLTLKEKGVLNDDSNINEHYLISNSPISDAMSAFMLSYPDRCLRETNLYWTSSCFVDCDAKNENEENLIDIVWVTRKG